MEQHLQIQNDGGGELSLNRPAEVIFKEAEMVVAPWAKRVEALALYKKIGDSKHLLVEAWQMLAACYRVSTRLVSTNYLDYGEVKGFEARVEAIHLPTGMVIGTADAMCLNDEDKWGLRTKYEYVNGKREPVGFVNAPLQQLRSMAQTRAQGKVLASLFKWVARMKGFAGAPAEEMTGHEYDERGAAQPAPPQRRSQQSAAPAPASPPEPRSDAAEDVAPVITEAQAKRLYAIAMGKMDRQRFEVFLAEHGYSHSRQVPKSRYDELINDIEAL
jgi:hypothetical protein